MDQFCINVGMNVERQITGSRHTKRRDKRTRIKRKQRIGSKDDERKLRREEKEHG